jgi:lysophospholipid acyltransferase (LPLAT)-like uncharacterized protein
MALISGTVTYQAVVTVVCASSGDGDLVAAMFSGMTIGAVSGSAATASNASGTVTITWADSAIRVGDGIVLTTVANLIAANTALTSPVSITNTTRAYLTN